MPSEAWLRRIDHLVAEKVMKWQPIGHSGTDIEFLGRMVHHGHDWWITDTGETRRDFSPTRDAYDAMLVFERCEDMRLEHFTEGDRAYVAIDGAGGREPDFDSYTAFGPTPMLAISLGSLERADVEVPTDE